MIIAGMGGFGEEQFFEVEPAIRDAGAPRVDFGTATPAGPEAPGAMAPGPEPTPPPPAGGGTGFSP